LISNKSDLDQARNGDIRAFQTLFSEFQPQLKSYLYRLTANRSDMEDLLHDTFILAFEKIRTFRGEASLKTWVFTLATHHATRYLQKRSRWATDTLQKTPVYVHSHDDIDNAMTRTHRHSSYGTYDIKEHIDYCFTCVAKMLPIDKQLALILKDVYEFDVKEIAAIMDRTTGVVKHLLHDARHTMITIFDHQCALVSKKGVCDQCSRLNGRFNPKQNAREELMKLELVKEAAAADTEQLYDLRAKLVRAIDPLNARGTELHDIMLSVNDKINNP